MSMEKKGGGGTVHTFGVITINDPPPLLDEHGCATVNVDLTANVQEIAAWVYRNGFGFPADPPIHARFKTVTAVNETIDHLGGALVPVGGTHDDNMVVVWSKAAGEAWGSKAKQRVTFQRPAMTPPVTVSATNCVFFAYAPLRYTGPMGCSDNTYRPIALTIPKDATGVRLTAAGDWRHDPGDGFKSGPDGRTQDATNHVEYQSAGYNSTGINLLTDKFNLLVGFVEKDLTTPTAQIPIGAGPKDIAFPAGDKCTRVFLGMHDSHEWNNNSGTVTVTVQWQ
jgi:hypothetical protein